jgi:hypothetical protein
LQGRYVDNLTAAQIAKKMSVPTTTAQARLRKGEQVLQDEYKKFEPSIESRYSSRSSQDSWSFGPLLIVLVIVIALAFAIGSNTEKRFDQTQAREQFARAAAQRAANAANWTHYAQTRARTRAPQYLTR